MTARAAGEVAGPGGLFGFLPGVTVRADAVAVAGARRMTGRRAGSDEAGAATLMVVACAAVLLLLGCALGVVAAMVRAHRVAQSAADLAALAAAGGPGPGRRRLRGGCRTWPRPTAPG